MGDEIMTREELKGLSINDIGVSIQEELTTQLYNLPGMGLPEFNKYKVTFNGVAGFFEILEDEKVTFTSLSFNAMRQTWQAIIQEVLKSKEKTIKKQDLEVGDVITWEKEGDMTYTVIFKGNNNLITISEKEQVFTYILDRPFSHNPILVKKKVNELKKGQVYEVKDRKATDGMFSEHNLMIESVNDMGISYSYIDKGGAFIETKRYYKRDFERFERYIEEGSLVLIEEGKKEEEIPVLEPVVQVGQRYLVESGHMTGGMSRDKIIEVVKIYMTTPSRVKYLYPNGVASTRTLDQFASYIKDGFLTLQAEPEIRVGQKYEVNHENYFDFATDLGRMTVCKIKDDLVFYKYENDKRALIYDRRLEEFQRRIEEGNIKLV